MNSEDIFNDYINRNEVGLNKLKEAIFTAVINLFYLKLLYEMQPKQTPFFHISIPKIDSVSSLLLKDSQLLKPLADLIFRAMIADTRIQKHYHHADMFSNLYFLNRYYNTYIHYELLQIPGILKEKLNIDRNSEIQEISDKSIFSSIEKHHIFFIIEEAILALLADKLSWVTVTELLLTDTNFISLDHPLAIADLYIDSFIMQLAFMKIISFVNELHIENNILKCSNSEMIIHRYDV